mgnify:CR=1 FL=1
MVDEDVVPFVSLLRDVYGMYPQAKPLTETQAAMFFRALAEHSLAVVRAALDGHVKDPQRGRFPPLPADLLSQIACAAADDGRPGPEEAWAMSLAAADERVTVVWTGEAAHAWAAAKPVFAIGDEVGARMAFREVYGRLVAEARAQGRPVQWAVSLGWDEEGRREPIAAAVAAGRLPVSHLQALPAPVRADATMPFAASDRGPALACDAVRDRLRKLADELRSQADLPLDTSDRDRTNALKAEAEARYREYVARQADGDEQP